MEFFFSSSKEYGTVGGNQPAKRSFRDDKFSIFDVLSQQNKFESKNEIIDKSGFMGIKTPVVVNQAELPLNEMKIEFETKTAGNEKLKTEEEKEVAVEVHESLNKNNVYLQVLFKILSNFFF
jgi:hypothetical protein